MVIEQRSPEAGNPVSSFESGLMMLNGEPVGVCIKFAMYDRTAKITYWTPTSFTDLIRGLDAYAEALGGNAFMFRATEDSSLVDRLPARHPYHTLITEAPKITADELGDVSNSTQVNGVTLAHRGPTLEVRPVYGNGRRDSIFMHEYTALSLVGYLRDWMESATRLMGPAAGNA